MDNEKKQIERRIMYWSLIGLLLFVLVMGLLIHFVINLARNG